MIAPQPVATLTPGQRVMGRDAGASATTCRFVPAIAIGYRGKGTAPGDHVREHAVEIRGPDPRSRFTDLGGSL